MDHLPVVPNGIVRGLETVPYVCEKPYDGGPFLTYPIREGKPEITSDEAGMPDTVQPFWQYEKRHPTPNKDFEAFCQTWLFFGLINELLGDTCKSADFVRLDKAGDSRVISTAQLAGLVEQWVKNIEDGSYAMTHEHAARCLRLTFETLRAAGPEFDLRVKLCIASVAELFTYATNKAFGVVNWVSDSKCPSSWRRLFNDTLWVERFKMSGWCPSQIEIMMRTSTSLQSLHFFASMQDSISAGRHLLCNSWMCVAYQTDLKHYETQHVTKGCPCEDLHVDMSSLNAVVTSGGVPLLHIRETKTLNELTVEIVASQPDTCYLALSHVWADGLGNAKANALPRCQLLHLSRLVQSLRPKSVLKDAELLFWCDTLCCPAAPGEAKKKVLEQMKDIYERATCVLVLDASIRLYESEGMCAEEACARILVSGWVRRLWTLQEGALPADQRRVWFQFRDQAVDFDSLWQQLYKSFNNDLGRTGLVSNINWRMRTLRAFFNRDSNIPGGDLAMVEVALQYRSVSVSSDEPLLIGNLLDLDVAELLKGSDETRIHRMWSLMSSAVCGIPKNILFRLGPRLREEGYRWAPSTMLYREDSNAPLQMMVKEEDDQGFLTEHGLKVRLSGYHISFPQRPSGLPASPWGINLDENNFYMRDEKARWYFVRRRWPSAEGDYLSKEKFGPIMRSHTNLWAMHHESSSQKWSDVYKQTNTALLTRLVQESYKVKYVKSYMHIHIGHLRDTQCEMFEAAYRCAQKLAESAPAQQLANMSTDDVDMESPEYKAVFDTLQPEIYRLAARGENELAMTAARESSSKDHDVLFGALVGTIFIGNYGIMGPRTPNDQQWCVD